MLKKGCLLGAHVSELGPDLPKSPWRSKNGVQRGHSEFWRWPKCSKPPGHPVCSSQKTSISDGCRSRRSKQFDSRKTITIKVQVCLMHSTDRAAREVRAHARSDGAMGVGGKDVDTTTRSILDHGKLCCFTCVCLASFGGWLMVDLVWLGSWDFVCVCLEKIGFCVFLDLSHSQFCNTHF